MSLFYQSNTIQYHMQQINLKCEHCHINKNFNTSFNTQIQLATCCSTIFCSECFNDFSVHGCIIKKIVSHNTISNQNSQTQSCGRCRERSALYVCRNCPSGFFCQECNSTIHNTRKYDFHDYSLISKLSHETVNSENKNNNQNQSNKPQKPSKINAENPELIRFTSPKRTYSSKIKKAFNITQINIHAPIDRQNDNSTIKYDTQIRIMKVKLNNYKSDLLIKQMSLNSKWSQLQNQIQQKFNHLMITFKQKLSECKIYIDQKRQNQLQLIKIPLEMLKKAEYQAVNIQKIYDYTKVKSQSKINCNSKNQNQYIKFIKPKFESLQANLINYQKKVRSKNSKQTQISEFIIGSKKLDELLKNIQKINYKTIIQKKVQQPLKEHKNSLKLKRMTSSTFLSYGKSPTNQLFIPKTQTKLQNMNDKSTISITVSENEQENDDFIKQQSFLDRRKISILDSITPKNASKASIVSSSNSSSRNLLKTRQTLNINHLTLKSSTFLDQQKDKVKQKVMMKKSTIKTNSYANRQRKTGKV